MAHIYFTNLQQTLFQYACFHITAMADVSMDVNNTTTQRDDGFDCQFDDDTPWNFPPARSSTPVPSAEGDSV